MLKKNEVVDHKYHRTNDNRKSQLRVCTSSQNSQNASKKSNNTSGYVGVCWHKNANKWCATICLNKKQIHLGSFDDIKEAIQVRKDAELYYYGDYKYTI